MTNETAAQIDRDIPVTLCQPIAEYPTISAAAVYQERRSYSAWHAHRDDSRSHSSAWESIRHAALHREPLKGDEMVRAYDGTIYHVVTGGDVVGSVDDQSLAIGDRVEGGTLGTEDHDTGRVLRVDGDQVEVAWDSGVRTTQTASLLRVTGARLA